MSDLIDKSKLLEAIKQFRVHYWDYDDLVTFFEDIQNGKFDIEEKMTYENTNPIGFNKVKIIRSRSIFYNPPDGEKK